MTDEFPKGERLYYYCPHLEQTSDGDIVPVGEVRQECPISEANLVGSLCDDGLHRPALDIDLPCQLVPSSTPGHFHLYIDKAMDQASYLRLIDALADAGIVGPFYAKTAHIRGQTFLRVPWVKKGQEG